MTGRPDINQLASKNVEEGNMMAKLATPIREDTARLYPKGSLTKYLRGSTYIGLSDIMVLHLNPPNSCIEAVVQRKSDRRGQMSKVTISLQRSWSPLIIFLHTEDPDDYGTPMPAIPYYSGGTDQATMMMWAVASVIAGCKDVHRGIDKKVKPFTTKIGPVIC